MSLVDKTVSEQATMVSTAFGRFRRRNIDTAAMLRSAANPMESLFYGHNSRVTLRHHYLRSV